MDLSLLTPEEFDAHLSNKTLRLAFVGMSNAGKSYRSRILNKENDFLWYQVDEEIQKALGFSDMSEISSWLGYPNKDSYEEREKNYLELENKFTSEASMQTGGKNFVFDTTGSVGHLEETTISILKANCLVVNLEMDENNIGDMIEKFFKEPKPVCWAGNFSTQEDESQEDALRRSYPILLQKRLKKYRELAHISIPALEVRDATGEKTLAVIRSYLK